ncbi:MAG: epoxyqueuosine reductase QueH [Lachnospiraceae bacterium]|nr:epoxyqueuosine reductase QueH [Lachnospiraceae bacterium]
MENYDRKMQEICRGLSEKGEVPRLLLHSCCAPCSSSVLEQLTRFFEVTVFYYNPNIFPAAEFDFRLEEQRTFLKTWPLARPVELLAAEYRPQEFLSLVKGLENEPERGARCTLCYRLRLARTAEEAAKRGFDWFASTLTLSPLKDAARLNRIGEEEGRRCGVNWLVSDFKKRDGYLRSTEITRACGMYRQEYCGCIYSLAERCRQGAPSSAQKEV